MVYCVVPGCGSGGRKLSAKAAAVSYFRFPKCPELLSKWLEGVAREGWKPTSTSKICSLHFNESDHETEFKDSNISRMKDKSLTRYRLRKKLRVDAVPSVFPGTESWSLKKAEELRRVAEEIETFWKADIIMSLDDVRERKEEVLLPSLEVDCLDREDSLIFLGLDFTSVAPRISFHLQLNSDLTTCMSAGGRQIQIQDMENVITGNVVNTVSCLISMLAWLKEKSEEEGEEDEGEEAPEPSNSGRGRKRVRRRAGKQPCPKSQRLNRVRGKQVARRGRVAKYL